jgi:hypothetical protein
MKKKRIIHLPKPEFWRANLQAAAPSATSPDPSVQAPPGERYKRGIEGGPPVSSPRVGVVALGSLVFCLVLPWLLAPIRWALRAYVEPTYSAWLRYWGVG